MWACAYEEVKHFVPGSKRLIGPALLDMVLLHFYMTNRATLKAHYFEARMIDYLNKLHLDPCAVANVLPELQYRYGLHYPDSVRSKSVMFYIQKPGPAWHTHPVIFDYARSCILHLNPYPTRVPQASSTEGLEHLLLPYEGDTRTVPNLKRIWATLAELFKIQHPRQYVYVKHIFISEQEVRFLFFSFISRHANLTDISSMYLSGQL